MQNYSWFESDPFDFLSYDPEHQLPANSCDPFDSITALDSTWTESTESHPLTYTAPVAEDLSLHPTSITEDQCAPTEPTREGVELRQVVQNLQERTERIENMIESLHNE